MESEYYITVFSLKLYRELKKHNQFPFSIEPNRKYPQYNVFKYHDNEEVRQIIDKFKKDKQGG